MGQQERREEWWVDCTVCGFQRRVKPGDDVLPADVVTEHGQETGHKLNIERIE